MASNMNGIYAQVLDLDGTKRELTLFDGDFTVEAVLTPSAIDNLLRENGVTFGQLQGKRIAIVRSVVLPLLNEFPPSLKLILTNVRVFVDSMANRPIQDPPKLINHPRIRQVLRTARLEQLAKRVPTKRPNYPIVSNDEDRSGSPPRSTRLEPPPIPPPQEPLPEVSDSFRRLSLPPVIVPEIKDAGSTPEKLAGLNPEANTDIELLEGNISPIHDDAPEANGSKSVDSNPQDQVRSPKNTAPDPSKSPTDEDNSTLEVDDEDQRNALPELHENLIQRGFLRGRCPPPIGSINTDDIVEDGDTPMAETEHAENGETRSNVENNDGEGNANVAMMEENEAMGEEKLKKKRVLMPVTQLYDEEDEEDDDEENPVPLKEEKTQRNETMPMTQHYDDEEEVNEPDKTQEGDHLETQVTEGEPLSTLSSDRRMPWVPIQHINGDASNTIADAEDKVTEVLSSTLPEDPIEGAPAEEEKTVEVNEADKNTSQAKNESASKKREIVDVAGDDEVEGSVKKAREGNDEELRVVYFDKATEKGKGKMAGASAETEPPSVTEMEENEGQAGKKLLIENPALLALVSERADAAMKCFDRFAMKEGGDIWDVILP